MSHFALVYNGVVEQVIVAEQDYIDSLPNKTDWVKCSYNTRGNVHYGADGQPDGLPPLRGNYPGRGYIYDAVRDVFYLPKPHPQAVLDENTWTWSGFPVTITEK